MDEARRVSDIAEIMQIDDAAISNILRRMEKDKLITRRKSKTDGRSIEAKATPYGAKIAIETEKKFEALNEILEQNITSKDREILYKLVKVIHENTS